MRRAYLFALLVLCSILITPISFSDTGTAQAQSKADSCINPRSDIALQNGFSVPRGDANVTGRLSYNQNTQNLTITYRNLSSVDEFWVDLTTTHYNRGVRVVNATGFANLSSDIGYSFQWDGETRRPQLTLTVINQPAPRKEDHEYAATPRWGFFPVPSHSPATNLTFAGQGFVGDQFILAGPNTIYTATAGCQDIRLIVPRAANLSESPSSIVDSLASASRQFDVGPRYSYINAYAVTDPIRRGGAAETHEFWVHDSATFGFSSEFRGGVIPANTWLHEYVHTRQLFVANTSVRLGDRMWWFTEASASYYAVELTTRQQYAGPCEYTYYFWNVSRTRMGQVVLSNQSRWGPNDQGQYRKGAVVLSALDQRIQNETNGQRSLDDVVYRINTHEGTVTYTDFKQIVESVAGTSLDSWLDARITTSTYPEPGLQKNACRWHLTIEQLLYTNKGRVVLAMAALTVFAAGYRIYQWRQS
jgi:hypothetical protein